MELGQEVLHTGRKPKAMLRIDFRMVFIQSYANFQHEFLVIVWYSGYIVWLNHFIAFIMDDT